MERLKTNQKLFVIKFNNGKYLVNSRKLSKSLRMAKIYQTEKYAVEAAKNFLKEGRKYCFDKSEPTSYELKEVEIYLKEEKRNDKRSRNNN